MNIIGLSINRPTAVLSAVIMTVIFGLVALETIPIQLIPDIRRPIITVNTSWPGASPLEIEREIVNKQEDALKGLEGVVQMVSRSRVNSARVVLEFGLGQDMNRALLMVGNRLDQIGDYPDEAREPTIKTADSDDNAISWMIITRQDGNTTPMSHFGDFIEDTVKERMERIKGVAASGIYGGAERELRVTVDPQKLAQYRLTVPDVVSALRNANANISAGDVEEGKRSYLVRTEGEFANPQAVADVVLRSVEDPFSGRTARVTVGDIGTVAFDYKEGDYIMRSFGEPSISVNVVKESGANVMKVMAGVREALNELNEGRLKDRGLKIEMSYDETTYIQSAINLVQQNILVGGSLAILLLMIFLRSPRATTVVALAIPVSIVGTFVAIAGLGGSINVISLAGIAFAVGMVVDAAIVVLENIYRLRATGMRRRDAAYHGTKQVWGAVLVSAVTTVAVFAPILMMEADVGQVFRDIGVAISVSVILSLVVSMTVIPALAAKLLPPDIHDTLQPTPLPGIDHFARFFVRSILGFTRWAIAHQSRAIAIVAVITGIMALGTWAFLPKLDYLPDGNMEMAFGRILPPPGYNKNTTSSIANKVEEATRPYWAPLHGPEDVDDQPPKLRSFFFFARGSFAFIGARPVDGSRTREILPILKEPVFKEPGTFGFFSQRSLFGRSLGGTRVVQMPIAGTDVEEILQVAQRAAAKVQDLLPREEGHQMRPKPGLELGAPEVRLIPDRVRLSDNGVSAQELGVTVDAFNDGLRIEEITIDGERMDLTLKGPSQGIFATQSIENLPVVTRSGTIIPARNLATIEVTAGPTEIHHLETYRVITLDIRPDSSIPLEEVMELLQSRVIDELRAEGIPQGMYIGLAGSADKLTQAWQEILLNLALAILIVYLVMAILFENFLYPLVIMLAVPLATAGGVAGLTLLNAFTGQMLDMLTMLGFIILIGIVVNNAILLVHQTLHHIREDRMSRDEAILESTRNRIRPIFMSTLTSIFGMLPLVLFPGAGSELYRGLGSVVVGGLSLSALMTLLIIPPMLKLVLLKSEEEIKDTKIDLGSQAPAE